MWILNPDTRSLYNQIGQVGDSEGSSKCVAGRGNLGGSVVQQSGIQCFNCKEFGHYAKECRKPKRVKDYSYHKEKMLLCKQAEKGVQLQAEQYDWLQTRMRKLYEQELEAHYSYMQSESISNTCAVEMGDSNVIPDSPDMCDNDIQDDQNDVECDDERVALANLIANLKLDVDAIKDSKSIKEANATFDSRVNECKSILAETSRTLGESNSIQDSCLVALQNKQTEFERICNCYVAFARMCVKKMVCRFILLTSSDLDEITELQCLYLHKVMECDCLAQKLSEQTDFVSKEIYTELLQRFARLEKHSISLEIALQECQVQLKNDTVCKEKASNVFRKEREQYVEIQDLKAQLQDKNMAISELRKLVEKCKGKSVDTKFDKPSVVRQPNAQKIPKPSIDTIHPIHIVDSGCTKDMTGNVSTVCNFVEKYWVVNLCDGILDGCISEIIVVLFEIFKGGNDFTIRMVMASKGLSHLNFDYINLLSKKDVVIGLPKLKYVKDQLCSSCEVSKAKRSSFKSKDVQVQKGRLMLLHMDLCGPMRVASINGKKYILVIVDDYSRYTWTLFLRSKDETPEVLKDFLTMIQRNLQAPVISVRTDRGTEFLNKTLNAFFKEEGIEHQTSTPRTPEQNGACRSAWRNRTLVEACFERCFQASILPLCFWAEQSQPHVYSKQIQSSSQLSERRHTTSLMTENPQSNTFTSLVVHVT
ncbi:retrovirus-related pol polyprotein from transposon TNT 1-94 [Tanacetum coccineum]|uniref:Retrovirus-related pol polyprotein from transposon TNT 1-94 n=1 Tax=Tanacetum coccineum TaxID=301880 RepID=A0ABQ5H789_9ASTR